MKLNKISDQCLYGSNRTIMSHIIKKNCSVQHSQFHVQHKQSTYAGQNKSWRQNITDN